jgi:hypothetical protein
MNLGRVYLSTQPFLSWFEALVPPLHGCGAAAVLSAWGIHSYKQRMRDTAAVVVNARGACRVFSWLFGVVVVDNRAVSLAYFQSVQQQVQLIGCIAGPTQQLLYVGVALLRMPHLVTRLDPTSVPFRQSVYYVMLLYVACTPALLCWPIDNNSSRIGS